MLDEFSTQLSQISGGINEDIVRITLAILCRTENSLPLTEICRYLGQRTAHNPRGYRIGHKELYQLLKLHPNKFEILQADGLNEWFVLAKSNLELCSKHCSKNGHCPGLPICDALHVCKYYLLSDSCRFKGNRCHFGHNLTTTHNQTLLRNNLLDHLSVSELKHLFRKTGSQSTSSLKPSVCKFYNNESGCTYKSGTRECPRMHICRYYLIGECRFGRNCKRNHDLYDAQVLNVLSRHGIDTKRSPKEVLFDLRKAGVGSTCDTNSSIGTGSASRSKYNDLVQIGHSPGVQSFKYREVSQVSFSISNSTDSGSSDLDSDGEDFAQENFDKEARGQMQRQKSADGVIQEICMFSLRGKCGFGRSCRRYHRDFPYQWQYSNDSGQRWEDVPEQENESLELNYCMEGEDGCWMDLGRMDVYLVSFDQMKGLKKGKDEISLRRISTVSKAKLAVAHPLSTQWKWFWQDQKNSWVMYGEQNVTGYRSAQTSVDIEKNYLDNPEGQMRFSTLGHEYVLDFKHMTQQNLESGMHRKVRRRPVFVTKEEINQRKKIAQFVPGAAGSRMTALQLPTSWSVDRNISPEEFSDYFVRVPISVMQKESGVHSKITNLFRESMPAAEFVSIERIENGELWMNFCSKRDKMKRKSPTSDLNERQLFHGTHNEYVDAICRQGFDFRFSGRSTGTKFGKGSYFAKSARYADSYTDSHKVMFVVRVLPGDMTQGSSSYVRPPPKNPKNPLDLYDSCVDNVRNPNIFVIFTFDQVYPEYLIKYKVRK